MKFHLIQNDRSTRKDELLLALLIGVWFLCGLLLVLYKPSVWILESAHTTIFGVLCILTAIMFLPVLIYRLLTNDKK